MKMEIKRIKELLQAYRMLCSDYSLSLTEFVQIFAFDDSETLFNFLDDDSNGLIDVNEFFTILVLFSESNPEDRMRFLFDLFDTNANGYLEEIDLQFMFYSCVGGLTKIYDIQAQGTDVQGSVGDQLY